MPPTQPPVISGISRSKAWFCVVVNQLAFPGLGTIMARRPAGYIQAITMVVGFCLVLLFAFRFILACVTVLTDNTADLENWHAALRENSWAVISGLGLCLVAWVWSLFSSIQILRQVPAGPPNALPPKL